MNFKDRITSQTIKVVLILTVIIFVIFQSGVLNAQALKKFARDYQLGFEGSFGVKTFSLSSNIAALNGLNVTEEGGSVGVAIGAQALRIKIRQGYFYSSSAVVQTVDEVRSAFIGNFYPLQLLIKGNSRFQPYFTGGIERNILKMYGTYDSENTQPRNYSVSEAPFLGKLATVVTSFGAGLEYNVKGPGNFVSFFAEARYGKPVGTTSSSAFFNQTNVSDQLLINVGIGFGYNK
jgi:hypothetical protein